MSQTPNIYSIFCTAIEMKSPDDRQRYVHEACGGDAELVQQIERLLQAHFSGGSMLDKSAYGLDPTLGQREIAEIGESIGPFKLLQKIGEGGFGVVYMAEQQEPVRRKVALKIIKPGMDTKEVIARFEAERQALALMDHPNIAKVFDGGATSSGRPYFVMELVKGVSLTQFCDESKLPTSKRLELFRTVCQAIQHAHHKGVIHRDIKPSNVLVTLHDGEPVVKVIDFGIAKAISQQLTAKTMFTAFGQMMGTLQYMSPEQAAMSGLDIDTRSDVYSLGVLLYELLTGTTPLDIESLRSAAYAEVQRVIRETEAPRPSNRLSAHGAASARIAQERATDPKRLHGLLRGDLDWIVMRALEKDRKRRYDSAGNFAEDIRRHLVNETVEACPPSATYRIQKFVRRNRLRVIATGAVVGVILLAATAAYFARISWLVEQRRIAAAAASNRLLLTEKKKLAEERIFQGDYSGSETAIQAAIELGASSNWTSWRRGQIEYHQGNLDKCLQLLESASGELNQHVAGRALLATVYSDVGDYEKYLDMLDTLDETLPSDFESLLYKGRALSYQLPGAGLPMLDRAVSTKQCFLSHLARAAMAMNHAVDMDDRTTAEKAVADVMAARLIRPENPEAIHASACANLFASLLFSQVDATKREYYHAKAGEELELLAALPIEVALSWDLGELLEWHGQGDRALKFWELVMQNADLRSKASVRYALAIYKRGDVVTGIKFASQSTEDSLLRASLLASLLIEVPESRREGLELNEKLVDAVPKRFKWVRSHFLLQLGKTAEAASLARESFDALKVASPRVRDQFEWQVNFLLDPSSEAEVLLLRAAGKRKSRQLEAHQLMACACFGRGERARAREHLVNAVSTHFRNHPSYEWCKIYLARMDQDPNWPTWMPTAKALE